MEDLARNLSSITILDFSKVFDKVNHLELLYKLQVHVVQGKTLGSIESFLILGEPSVRSLMVRLLLNFRSPLELHKGQSWAPYIKDLPDQCASICG